MCGPGCVDALFDKLQSKARLGSATRRPCAEGPDAHRNIAIPQIGPDVPCDQSVSQCVQSVTSPFLAANGNLQALLGCSRGEIATRLQPKLQCKGTKPTLDQVKAQVG